MAAVALLLFCVLSGRSLKYSPRQHGFIALQGLFLFSSNYLVFYWATGLLTSGIVALMFSTVILMNIVNGALFMRSQIRPRVILGAGFGIVGITAIFRAEVSGVGDNADTWRGLWMCLLATWFTSIGNIISVRNQRSGLRRSPVSGVRWEYQPCSKTISGRCLRCSGLRWCYSAITSC